MKVRLERGEPADRKTEQEEVVVDMEKERRHCQIFLRLRTNLIRWGGPRGGMQGSTRVKRSQLLS